MCGEKIEMPYELLLKEGLPPRMRGKARAARMGGAATWDHPRVCGEKII